MSYNKYKEYLKSKEWKLKRQKLFDKIGKECEQCGSTYYIEVHHLTYKNLFNEPLEDLQVLCKQCHLSKHDKYFEKYILVKPKKRKTKNRRRNKKYRPKITLDMDFKKLTVSQKRKYLKLKGWKL